MTEYELYAILISLLALTISILDVYLLHSKRIHMCVKVEVPQMLSTGISKPPFYDAHGKFSGDNVYTLVIYNKGTVPVKIISIECDLKEIGHFSKWRLSSIDNIIRDKIGELKFPIDLDPGKTVIYIIQPEIAKSINNKKIQIRFTAHDIENSTYKSKKMIIIRKGYGWTMVGGC